MNDTERNRTVSWIVTITIGLLVALLVGILFGFLGAKSHFRKERGKGIVGNAAQQYLVVLSYDASSGNCTQTVNGKTDALVHLSISNGDTIEWSPRTATTRVTFGGAAPNGPFDSTSFTGQSGYVGPSQNAQLGDDNFAGVMVNGHACSNFQGMGVHVDQ
jgi:hypothetical protein